MLYCYLFFDYFVFFVGVGVIWGVGLCCGVFVFLLGLWVFNVVVCCFGDYFFPVKVLLACVCADELAKLRSVIGIFRSYCMSMRSVKSSSVT